MLVVEWEGLSFGASRAKHQILEYLERERSDECDMVLAEALLGELLENISRCGPTRAKVEISWRDDGAAIFELIDLEPTIHPAGLAPTRGWGLMIAGAMAGALSVEPCAEAGRECVRAVLPVLRKGVEARS